MNLAEVLEAKPPSKRCKFAVWVDSLKEEDQATVATALANDEYSIRHLSRAFTQFGLDCSETVVWKHRTNQCKACA